MDHKSMLVSIGSRLYTARKAKGYTQQALAEKMGVSIQMISNAENGNKTMKLKNIIKICNALDISIDYLLTGMERVSAFTISEEDFAALTPEQRDNLKYIVDTCISMCKENPQKRTDTYDSAK